MRRPLCTVGFTLLLALTVLSYVDNTDFALIAALISYLLFSVGMLIKNSRKKLFVPAVCLSVCFSSLLFFFSQRDFVKLCDLADTKAQIVATVKDEPKYNINYRRYYCECELKTINNVKFSGNIRLSFSTDYEDISLSDFTIGNVLSFDGKLYEVGNSVSGIVEYFKSEKIYIGANNIKNLTVTRQGTKPIAKLGNEFRNKISNGLKKHFSSDTAGVLMALATGNKDSLSESIYSDFKLIGIVHLMAVSGMHLSILTMCAEFIIRKLRHKKLKNSILSIFVVFVMFLANFSPSVLRAGIMHLMRLTANSLNKKSDSLNSLGLSLIIILTVNPFACKSTSLLLSVLSTLSIITVSLPLSERLGTRSGDILNIRNPRLFSAHKAVVFSLVTSFSVMVFTVPVLAHVFGSFSLMSPVANLVFLPLSPLLISVAFLSALLCSVGLMPSFLADVIEGFTRLCIYIAHLLAKPDGFMVYIETEKEVLICFISCLSIIVFGFALRYICKSFNRRKRSKTT